MRGGTVHSSEYYGRQSGSYSEENANQSAESAYGDMISVDMGHIQSNRVGPNLSVYNSSSSQNNLKTGGGRKSKSLRAARKSKSKSLRASRKSKSKSLRSSRKSKSKSLRVARKSKSKSLKSRK